MTVNATIQNKELGKSTHDPRHLFFNNLLSFPSSCICLANDVKVSSTGSQRGGLGSPCGSQIIPEGCRIIKRKQRKEKLTILASYLYKIIFSYASNPSLPSAAQPC